MILLAGIDGTGPSDRSEYLTEFAASHVRVLTRTWDKGPAFYSRGPTDLGLQTERLAYFAAGFIMQHVTARLAMNEKTGVFLVGYSRGAAAALDACRKLHERKIAVDCLLLFDAVDRTNTVDSTLVPPNVRACFHAIRNPMTRSRAWFGNCGRQCESPGATAYKEEFFYCTHGALGGLPWKEGGLGGLIWESNGWLFPEVPNQGVPGFWGITAVSPELDALGSQQVRSWSQAALREAIDRCEARLTHPNPARTPAPSPPPPEATPPYDQRKADRFRPRGF